MNDLDDLATRLDLLREEAVQRELRRDARRRSGSHLGLVGAQRATVRRANRARALQRARVDVIDLRERAAARPIPEAAELRLWTRGGDPQLRSM